MARTLAQELTTGRLGCDCRDHVVTVDEYGIHFSMQAKNGVEKYFRFMADESLDSIKKWHARMLKEAPPAG